VDHETLKENDMGTPKPSLEGEAMMKTSEANTGAIAGTERRLAITLSEKAHQDLKRSAESTSRSMTDVVRIGIGLFKVAAEVMRENNKLVVISPDGKPLKEIVLPW
jgi:hypothetical protein